MKPDYDLRARHDDAHFAYKVRQHQRFVSKEMVRKMERDQAAERAEQYNPGTRRLRFRGA